VNDAELFVSLRFSSEFSDGNNGASGTGSFCGTGFRAVVEGPRGTAVLRCCGGTSEKDDEGMEEASLGKQGERGGTYGRLS
jgi:hypothetical protein